MPNHNEPAPLRVPFDSLTLAAVTAELRPLLVGGQIQDIRQPEPNELLLAIRSQGRSLTLLLSSDASPMPPRPPRFASPCDVTWRTVESRRCDSASWTVFSNWTCRVNRRTERLP